MKAPAGYELEEYVVSVRSLVSVTLLILVVFAIFTVPSFRHELLNLISDFLGSLQTLVNSWRGA